MVSPLQEQEMQEGLFKLYSPLYSVRSRRVIHSSAERASQGAGVHTKDPLSTPSPPPTLPRAPTSQKFSLCSRKTVWSECECFSHACLSAAAIIGAPQKTTPISSRPYNVFRSLNSVSQSGRPGLR